MLTTIKSHIKQRFHSGSLRSSAAPAWAAVMHCRGHQRAGSPVSQEIAKLIKLRNRSSIARSRTSHGSSDCPPELSSLSQYSPQEEENAEKWDYEEKKSTGRHGKEEKVLTLEAQQWKFMKSLLMPPAMGGMQYGQKAFAGRRSREQ
ncbi:unnamed protein product [Rangifer tarandus platyrhynchus]|uniref:Uncharacterized protein n=1 Tax=Rangifer tarandus platyrhynchus TaxID=3082113 RepID=A0ABN8ZXU4_RANTA|nr:unnamed protein product [Rangifer tarandus platyrhynchus]